MVTTHHEYDKQPAPGAPMTERERKATAGTIAGGTTAEAIVGATAVVLAILGLLGILEFYMLTIATICAGAALLIEGLALAAGYAKIQRESQNGDRKVEAGVGGGLTVQALGGATGVVLGLLALFGLEPEVLIPVAAIAMGASMLLGGGARGELSLEPLDTAQASQRSRHANEQAVKGAGAAMALAGIGAAVLGILVLADVGEPLVLSLVAMLTIGAAALLAGSAMLSRVGNLVHR